MTFTQEQLITQAREEVDFWRERDELIPSQQTAIRLRLAEITLAALTAEPDYYVVVTSVGVWQSFCKTKAEAEFIVSKPFNPGYSIREIYTAPPTPVVPETLPCPVLLEPGMRFGKGVRTQTMLDALQRRAEYSAELEAMTPEQRADHDAGMKEFAAMLQGAELPAYEIKSFGMFDARSLDQDGRDLVTTIQMFHFERGTVPEDVFSRGVVAKHALQAIINALQQKCDGMDDAPIPVIWPTPRPEVN